MNDDLANLSQILLKDIRKYLIECQYNVEVDAIDYAINALKIVNLIEETFKDSPDSIIYNEDWEDIKEEAENEISN